MSRQPLLICGLTPFAAMIAHYFDAHSDYEVVAFTVHQRFVSAPNFCGRRVVPIERLSAQYSSREVRFFAAVEYKWLNAARAQLIAEMEALGFQPASFIHPASHVCSTAQLGQHNLVMEAAVLSHGSVLGDNNVIFPQAFVGQSARIGSHNYLSPGVLIERYASVENHCFLGTGTSLAESGRIGSWCYTRARQHVVEPIPAGTTFNPALRAPGYVVDRRAKPSTVPAHS